MIIAIRISGQVKIQKSIGELLFRLRLRRKYSAVLMPSSTENIKLLKKVRNHIAFGEINEKTLKDLITKRAVPTSKDTKINTTKLMSDMKTTPISKLPIKPFFRLHPPRGGIDSKKHFSVSSKAVLGDNKEKINDLVRRML